MNSKLLNLGKLSFRSASRHGIFTTQRGLLMQKGAPPSWNAKPLPSLTSRSFYLAPTYSGRLYSSLSTERPSEKPVEPQEGNRPEGRIDFAVSNGLPRLTIPLPIRSRPNEMKEHTFMLHPELALSNLYHQIREHGEDIQLIHIHDSLKNHSVGARWTAGASVGDLIQESTMSDAKSFYVIADNAKVLIRLPSFEERTASLRSQLVNLQSRLDTLNKVKQKCDAQANRTSQMISIGGFASLCTYWVVMAKLVWIDLGWGVMEPFTYFSGIGMATVGYLYFLVTKREFNTDSVSNFAATQRQLELYVENGLNIELYQHLSKQANQVREQIDRIKTSYS
ncbi:hypothetical protein K493DRAFT_275267 [Basidiobolus meristosporus CBS 931.73]|uniref:Calcium uniporter protein, mitochondrial n=1 Tax=Basidiobolus meristosporus CBS 931.73 TaxID=1314790 RepID=A0A1Y1Z4Q8_9FUNG|nr:hypothetical protein K493DRAFT_275267 [Basidiobolus meristosporus CBS 931.73]|eukprot:ORY05251.1 hypothetical protein K493DRAFT_275267 [Basidiobolus meristosporus CBS 931.73]